MAEQQLADDLVRRLAARFRVLTLGGVAVITHGLSRNTHDLGVWLDPMDPPLAGVLPSFRFWPILRRSAFSILDRPRPSIMRSFQRS